MRKETEEERAAEEEEGRGEQKETKQYFSLPKGNETGGVAEKRGTSSIAFTSKDVSRSSADPKDIYTSQFPEEGHEVSSPNLGAHANLPSSANTPTDHAEASTQTDNSPNFQRLLDILMEMQGQIYALDAKFRTCRMQVKPFQFPYMIKFMPLLFKFKLMPRVKKWLN